MQQLPEDIRGVFAYLAEAFVPFGKYEAEAIARALIEDGLQLPNARSPKPFPFELWPRLLQMQEEVLQGRPVAYVCGKTWFYGLPIRCDERALIPRPETEEMVNAILEDFPQQAFPDLKVLDIGTGTGCIALALKSQRPDWEITAVDVSKAALALARENANALNLSINFVQDDLLRPDFLSEQGAFDLIVSNPPYIPPSEAALMDESVRRHEPSLALYAPEENPLLFYQHILQFCNRGGLRRNAYLYVEINEFRHKELLSLFKKTAPSKGVKAHKDMQGKWRWVCLVFSV